MERSVWTSFGPFGSCDISRKNGSNFDPKGRKKKKRAEWEEITKLSLLVRRTNCHLQGRNGWWLMGWIELDWMWCLDTIHTYRRYRPRVFVCLEREDHSPPEKGRGQRREKSDFGVPREISSFLLAIEEKNWLLLNSVVNWMHIIVCMDGYAWGWPGEDTITNDTYIHT